MGDASWRVRQCSGEQDIAGSQQPTLREVARELPQRISSPNELVRRIQIETTTNEMPECMSGPMVNVAVTERYPGLPVMNQRVIHSRTQPVEK